MCLPFTMSWTTLRALCMSFQSASDASCFCPAKDYMLGKAELVRESPLFAHWQNLHVTLKSISSEEYFRETGS